MIKAILFDLDGTLLPMDQDIFIKAYFSGLAKALAPLGYNQKQLIGGIWQGTDAMIQNDGSRNNEEAFWDTFCKCVDKNARLDEPHFDRFYRTDFQNVQQVCGFAPQAAPLVRKLRDAGLTVALATNPIFPAIATESRMRWAGFTPDDFALYTTYENIGYCKPNPSYYVEITKRLGVSPDECVMVGNDVGDDMVAATLGMKVFLLTDCLINKTNADISAYPHGGFEEAVSFFNRLLNL